MYEKKTKHQGKTDAIKLKEVHLYEHTCGI